MIIRMLGNKMKLFAPIFLLCTFKIHYSTSNIPGFEESVLKENYRLYGQALEAIFSMGFRLQAVMNASENENFVVSPLSTTAIVAQLMIGADGEFREQLHDLLSLPVSTASFNVTHFSKERNESQILPYAMFHLHLAILIKHLSQRKPGDHFVLDLDNALFFNEDIELRTVFTSTLNKMYNTDIMPTDFHKDASRIINKWASDHTNGLIRSFINNPLPPSTTSLFLNSIYFLADWEYPFSDFLNRIGDFYINPKDTVKALFMSTTMSKVPYAETQQYKLVCLPYKNRELGMYVLLPNIQNEYKYNIKKFISSVDPKDIFSSLGNMKLRDVNVQIPKLSLTNTLSILKPLQKYSVFKKVEAQKTRYETNAVDTLLKSIKNYENFTTDMLQDIYLETAAVGVDLKVSDIVQQMVFSINEKGTEAAAVAGGITDYIGGVKVLLLNRPFSFFIRHEDTQAVLFWGTITNPSKN